MKNDIIKLGDIEMDMADYAISGTAILGIRDSGKTVTAKGLAEQMQDAGYPFIVFDAVGKWRWLRERSQAKKSPHHWRVYLLFIKSNWRTFWKQKIQP